MSNKPMLRGTRWTKYHKEPYFSALMQAIRKVRFAGWTVKQASATYKIPNRSLRRYVEISADDRRRDSPFYLGPCTQVHNDTQKRIDDPLSQYDRMGGAGTMIPAGGRLLLHPADVSSNSNPREPTFMDVDNAASPQAQNLRNSAVVCMPCSPIPPPETEGPRLGSASTPVQSQSVMTMDCEPVIFPYYNGAYRDELRSPDDDDGLCALFADAHHVLASNCESPITVSAPMFVTPTDCMTATAKPQAMTNFTTQWSTNKAMEADPNLEYDLRIDDCHIQCFLSCISEIDFGL